MKWIHIDNRLPKFGERVLVLLEYNDKNGKEIISSGFLCCDRGWQFDYNRPGYFPEIRYWKNIE